MEPEASRIHAPHRAVPLNSTQAQLYRESLLNPLDPTNNLCWRLDCLGQFDSAAMMVAISLLVRRHEVLRAQILADQNGPTLHLHSNSDIPLRIVDLSHLPDARDQCERVLADEFHRAVDIHETHLIRALVVSIRDEEHVVALTAHQMIADREAMTVVVAELSELYQSVVEDRPTLLSTPGESAIVLTMEEIAWRKTPAAVEELRWWGERLAGAPRLRLPADVQEFTDSSRSGCIVRRALLPDFVVAAKEFASRMQTTPFTVFLSGFAALLSRLSGDDDLMISIPSSLRKLFGTDSVVGNFTNTLVLRANCSANIEFDALAAHLKNVISEASAHSRTRVGDVLETVHDRSGRSLPLLVSFEMFSREEDPIQLSSLVVTPRFVHNGTARFALALRVIEQDGDFSAELEYRSARITSGFAADLLNSWQELLLAALSKPSTRIAELPPQPIEPTDTSDNKVDGSATLTITQLYRWRDWISGRPSSAMSILLKGSRGLGGRSIASALAKLTVNHVALRTQKLEYRGGKLLPVVSSVPIVEEIQVDRSTDQDIVDLLPSAVDLKSGPLIQVAHLTGLPDRAILITLDPVLADPLSASYLVEALVTNGSQFSSPDPRSVAAAQEARIARPVSRAEAEGFWRRMLAHAPWEASGGADWVPAAGGNWKTAIREVVVSADLWQELVQACQKVGCSDWAAVLTAYAVVTCARSGSGSVVMEVLAPSSFRPPGIGPFAVSVPVCIDVLKEISLGELVQRVAALAQGALARGVLPREQILAVAEAPNGAKPRLGFYSLGLPVTESPLGSKAEACLFHRGASDELATLYFSAGEGNAKLQLVYATEAFQAGSADAILGQMVAFLQAFAANDAEIITPSAMLRPGEYALVVERFNDTAAELGQEALLDVLVAGRAGTHPDDIALQLSGTPERAGKAITYQQLLNSADALAQKLIKAGITVGELVGIYAERSIELAVGILGILRAGGAFLPLDPEYPSPRLQFLVEDSGVLLVLAPPDLDASFPSADTMTVDVEELLKESERQPANIRDRSPFDPAYLLYTSGSTGRPKGVVVSHRAICNRLLWMQKAYRLGSDDKVLQKTPISFDVSVWEFFWPWIAGATLVMCPPAAHRDTFKLGQVVEDEKITTLHFVPSMLRTYVDNGGLDRSRSVRRIMCSGESLTFDLVNDTLSGCSAELYNLYGPTEAAIDVTAHRCRTGERPVPIGAPISNMRLRILDPALLPLGVGHVGEIWLEGIGLADGYLGRPELTQERFVQSPFQPDERMYRTGDFGRWTAAGEVEFLGRIDGQIKLRGVRIEPGEIEVRLRALPKVDDAAVVLCKGSDGRATLAAFVEVNDATCHAGNLRAALEAELPPFLMPNVVHVLPELPRLVSGKIDRSALQSEVVSIIQTGCEYSPPTNAHEYLLCEIWRRVLGVERVGVNDDFFALGGDSLLAIEIVARARSSGVLLQLQDLFQARTVRALGKLPECNVQLEPFPPFKLLPESLSELPEDIVDAYPLPALMAGLVFESHTNSSYLVYTTSLDVHTPYVPELLELELADAIAAHPLLRASVMLETKSAPLLAIHRQARISIDYIDLRESPTEGHADRIADFLEHERRRPFDWTAPPLMRITILHRAERQFELVLSEPFLDGWSATLLLTQLLSGYARRLSGESPPTFPAPGASYAEFVEAELRVVKDERLHLYWENKLQEAEPSLLPASFRNEVSDSPQSRVIVPLTAQLSERLIQASVQAGFPLKSLVLAAHVHVVSALVGRDDVVTGLMSHGRPEIPEGDSILGLFLNTIALRLDAETQTWRELARRCFAAEVEALPAKLYPYTSLIAQHGVLFDTVFNFTHFRPYRELREATGLELGRIWASDQTYFPLTAHFRFDPIESQLQLRLDIDPAHVNSVAAERIGTYYQRSLELLSRDLDAQPDTSDLLTEREREVIAAGARPLPIAIDRGWRVDRLFVEQAQRTPDAVAFIETSATWSFKDIMGRASALVEMLRERGVGPGDRVAHWLQPGAAAVTACLSIAQAGAAFVPLSTFDPQERLAELMREANVRFVLVSKDQDAFWCADRAIPLAADFEAWPIREEPPKPIGGSEDALHILFTSGSTGRPKGVVTSHSTVLNRLAWAWEQYPFEPTDRLCLKTSLVFVDSIWEMFGGLLKGIPTALAPAEVARHPDDLVTFISRAGVTRITLVPSLLSEILGLRRPLHEDLAGLRQIIVSGEPFPTALGRALRERIPQAMIINLYGSTEVGGDVTFYELTGLENSAIVPLGQPINGCQMEVVDEHLRPVPIGVTGEVLVRGPVLADGYFGSPGAEQTRFLETESGRAYRTGDLGSLREDGVLEYRGRKDRQLKIRGVRIHAAEVEAALEEHPDVMCAAVAQRQIGGRMAFLAWLQTSRSGRDFYSAIRRHAFDRLQPMAVPEHFMSLESFPRTASGKIDYERLPTVSQIAAGFGADPEGPVAEALAAIWKEVLVLPRAGIDDDFLDLGGHSLTAIGILVRIEEQLSVRVSPQELMECRSLGKLALLVEARILKNFKAIHS